nr:MAG TPA: hypothetical protein [Caudoviricetes sp.]
MCYNGIVGRYNKGRYHAVTPFLLTQALLR